MEMNRNVLAECGIPQKQIDQRMEDVFAAIFNDPAEKFYFEKDGDAGYLLDTGNNDARTEGMSYGMMMAVQMNRKDLFDRLWRFSKRYMYNVKGPHAGYFAWSVTPEGKHNSDGPAPDGEEYYAMALFFAAARWGEGMPPLNYAAQARDILRHALHQPKLTTGGQPMWDPKTCLIRFVPELPFTDPSYHLPHFYDRFAVLTAPEDRPFWQRAAAASRAFLPKTCHPLTGMAPEYARYDGKPETAHGHGDFFSDAYRVSLNIGLDSAWNGRRAEYKDIVDHLQRFLWNREEYMTYTIDGIAKEPSALHPVGLIATTAAASLATDTALSRDWAIKFWQMPLRTGNRRYYDNCLYFFSLLILAGRYYRLT